MLLLPLDQMMVTGLLNLKVKTSMMISMLDHGIWQVDSKEEQNLQQLLILEHGVSDLVQLSKIV